MVPPKKKTDWVKIAAIIVILIILFAALRSIGDSTGSGDYYVLVDPVDDDGCWVVVIMQGNESILGGDDYRGCGYQRIYFDECNGSVDVFFASRHNQATGDDYRGDVEFRVYYEGTGWGRIVHNGDPASVEVECASWELII